MRSYVQPSFANPSAPYWLMPTPWPQPRPLTRNDVAVTGAGSTCAGARTPASAEAASARTRPVRAKSIGRMADPLAPRLAQAEAVDGRSLPNLQAFSGV